MICLDVQDIHHWFGEDREPLSFTKYMPNFVNARLPKKWVHGSKRNTVLGGVNLKVAKGQIVALVGPSGCGKSTLLRAILGTHPPCQGQICTDDRVINTPNREVGIVYQNYELYPFLTAKENVAFGLMLDQTSLPFRVCSPLKWAELRRKHIAEAVYWLEKLGLSDHVDKYPSEMSGGQRQRVAIAQALVMRPKILLLDEPFGALDEATREELQHLLLKLSRENEDARLSGKEPLYTIIIVTHELTEAFYVSDRVVALSQYHTGNSTESGYKNKMGAKIVYDKASPTYKPQSAKDAGIFFDRIEELRKTALDPTRLARHEECVTFWKDQEKIHGKPQ